MMQSSESMLHSYVTVCSSKFKHLPAMLHCSWPHLKLHCYLSLPNEKKINLKTHGYLSQVDSAKEKKNVFSLCNCWPHSCKNLHTNY